MTDLEMRSGAQARRRRGLPRATVVATVALGALALARGAEATDLYPAPEFFAAGLTSASSWAEILRTSGVVGAFPWVIPTSINPLRVFLLTKTFDVPACSTR